MSRFCRTALLSAGLLLLAQFPVHADENQDGDGHTSLRTRAVDDAGKPLGVLGNPYVTGISCALGGFATVNVTTTDQVVAAATPAGGVRHYLRLSYSVSNGGSGNSVPYIALSFGLSALAFASPYQLPSPFGSSFSIEWPSAGGFMPSDPLHVIASAPAQLIVESC